MPLHLARVFYLQYKHIIFLRITILRYFAISNYLYSKVALCSWALTATAEDIACSITNSTKTCHCTWFGPTKAALQISLPFISGTNASQNYGIYARLRLSQKLRYGFFLIFWYATLCRWVCSSWSFSHAMCCHSKIWDTTAIIIKPISLAAAIVLRQYVIFNTRNHFVRNIYSYDK